MKKRTRVLLIVGAIVLVIGIAVGLLFVFRAAPPTASNNVPTNQVPTNNGTVAPRPPSTSNGSNNTVSSADEAAIEEVATLFVEFLGTYDDSTYYSNVNLAASHATEQLAAKMDAYVAESRDAYDPDLPVVVSTVNVEQLDISASDASAATVVVKGQQTISTEGRTETSDLTATLGVVRIGEDWLVDSFSSNSPLGEF